MKRYKGLFEAESYVGMHQAPTNDSILYNVGVERGFKIYATREMRELFGEDLNNLKDRWGNTYCRTNKKHGSVFIVLRKEQNTGKLSEGIPINPPEDPPYSEDDYRELAEEYFNKLDDKLEKQFNGEFGETYWGYDIKMNGSYATIYFMFNPDSTFIELKIVEKQLSQILKKEGFRNEKIKLNTKYYSSIQGKINAFELNIDVHKWI